MAHLSSSRIPVSLFLSHDWPLQIWDYGNKERLLKIKPYFREDMNTGKLGSPPLMHLLRSLRPAYWFAAHLHVRFAATVPHGSAPVQSEACQNQGGFAGMGVSKAGGQREGRGARPPPPPLPPPPSQRPPTALTAEVPGPPPAPAPSTADDSSAASEESPRSPRPPSTPAPPSSPRPALDDPSSNLGKRSAVNISASPSNTADSKGSTGGGGGSDDNVSMVGSASTGVYSSSTTATSERNSAAGSGGDSVEGSSRSDAGNSSSSGANTMINATATVGGSDNAVTHFLALDKVLPGRLVCWVSPCAACLGWIYSS